MVDPNRWQYKLRQLGWLTTLSGMLFGVFLSTGRGASAIAVIVVFTLALLAASAFLLVEAGPVVRRWFVLGGLAGLGTAILLCLLQGPGVLAIDIFGPKSRHELRPAMSTLSGAVLLSGWLTLVCAIAGGAVAALRTRERFLVAVTVIYMSVCGVGWLRALITHEPIDPDRLTLRLTTGPPEADVPAQIRASRFLAYVSDGGNDN